MASKKAVVAARAAIIGVYKDSAKEALPKDQLDLLNRCLGPYTDDAVGLGIELFIFGQDNVWKDGQSVYSVLRKFCDEARQQILMRRSGEELIARKKDWDKWLSGASPEESAISRHCIRMLAEGKMKEARAFQAMTREEKLEQLPKGAISSATKHLVKLRSEGPPPVFRLPEETS